MFRTCWCNIFKVRRIPIFEKKLHVASSVPHGCCCKLRNDHLFMSGFISCLPGALALRCTGLEVRRPTVVCLVLLVCLVLRVQRAACSVQLAACSAQHILEKQLARDHCDSPKKCALSAFDLPSLSFDSICWARGYCDSTEIRVQRYVVSDQL